MNQQLGTFLKQPQYNRMDIRQTQLRETQPRLRRQTSLGLNTFFKSVIGGAFISFVEDALNRKPTVQENEESIKENFKKINDLIDTVQKHVAEKLKSHQQELFSMVREEIEEMQKETQKAVEELNKKIKQKDVDSEVWQLSNELDYFKNTAFKLFQENKHYRLKIKLLQKQIEDHNSEKQCFDALMQKFKKKCLKGKSLDKQNHLSQNKSQRLCQSPSKKEPIIQNNQVQGFQKIIISKSKELQRPHQIEDMKEGNNSGEADDAKSVINIHVTNNPKGALPIFTFEENNSRALEQLSLPSLTLNQSNYNSLPPAHIIKVESYSCSSNNNKQPVKVNQSTQTDDKFMPKSNIAKSLVNPFNKSNIFTRSKRCNTERNMEALSCVKDEEEDDKKEVDISRHKKHTFRVAFQGKKEGRSILYLSNALINSKLRPEKLLASSRKYSELM